MRPAPRPLLQCFHSRSGKAYLFNTVVNVSYGPKEDRCAEGANTVGLVRVLAASRPSRRSRERWADPIRVGAQRLGRGGYFRVRVSRGSVPHSSAS